ncbi:MAG: leucyl/phenylalanyl-tRNA--protein transferase [Candidatus Obscuribacterales bacterium]|nr:leucyl/phenylalanyl-tRNA--protein transferase [Candidatus Obscuribacterales bacterium]
MTANFRSELIEMAHLLNRMTPDLIVKAYSMGVFPMGDSAHPNAPVRWYAPDPRCILDIENFHTPKRLARTYRQGKFECRVNSAWSNVLRLCAARDSTWITEDIYRVYTELHRQGLAHSVEVYSEGKLAGGLYGVSLGGAFMGESMFHIVTDASKIALIFLVERMKERGFTLLDCQFMTEHLSKFGAINIPQSEYMARLQHALELDVKFN